MTKPRMEHADGHVEAMAFVVRVGLVAAKAEGGAVFEPCPALLVPLAAHQPADTTCVLIVGIWVVCVFGSRLVREDARVRLREGFFATRRRSRHQRIVLTLQHERHVAPNEPSPGAGAWGAQAPLGSVVAGFDFSEQTSPAG